MPYRNWEKMPEKDRDAIREQAARFLGACAKRSACPGKLQHPPRQFSFAHYDMGHTNPFEMRYLRIAVRPRDHLQLGVKMPRMLMDRATFKPFGHCDK